jgi:hypothetical protein
MSVIRSEVMFDSNCAIATRSASINFPAGCSVGAHVAGQDDRDALCGAQLGDKDDVGDREGRARQ